MTKLTDNLYAVEVPEDAINFSIRPYFERPNLFFKIKISWVVERKSLLYGNWSIIGTVTKDSIDFDCREFIEGYGIDRWRNYKFESQYEEVLKSNPDDSFRSLLTSKGLTDYSKLVIIKKVL